MADEMLIAPFNDFDYIRLLLAEYGSQIAGLIVEPLQRIIPPAPGFLELLREECDRHGIGLISDEVATGFRFAHGGAQEHYGVTPDLCTVGKVIGGGFPLAATVGQAGIMAHFDKAAVGDDVWLMQLGTLPGNSVAAAAGLKNLEILRREGQYRRLRDLGDKVSGVVRDALDPTGIPYRIVGDATLFEVVFTANDPQDYRAIQTADEGGVL